MNQTLKITAIALSLSMAGFSFAATTSAIAGNPAAETSAENQILTFAIEKMTCAMCPITVRKAIGNVDGVTDVEVDFEAKTATVTFDPAIVGAKAIAAASTNAGYPAQVVE